MAAKSQLSNLSDWTQTTRSFDSLGKKSFAQKVEVQYAMKNTGRLICYWLLFNLLAAPGCGDGGPKLYEISGTVTFKGQPVPAGTVMFTPDQRKGGSGPSGLATIKQGRYDTADSDGTGVMGGPYVVQIIGLDGKPTEMCPEGVPLFPDYTESIDLPRQNSTKDFETASALRKPNR